MRHVYFHIEEKDRYPRRIALCAVLALLVTIAAFRFWPTWDPGNVAIVYDTRGQELITMEEITPTRQQVRTPPPPAPVPPVVVPDDVILPEEEIDLTEDLQIVRTPDRTGDTSASGTPTTGTVRPDAGPRPVRFVEPEYTEEARKRKIRAEVVVEVLVDTRGRVQETRVVERFLVKDREAGERESVAQLGYGLEEAALTAARDWVFRPARQDGRIVEAWTTVTFTFGL